MIRTEGLTKRFGDKLAVDDLDLEVRAGEFFCFLGPNGAGKTTTIKLLTGLLRPNARRAPIGGHDIQREPLAAKRLLGYVPDQPFLYDRLTVREFLSLVAGLYGMDGAGVEARIAAMLEVFDVADVCDDLIGDLSHGMRQKLSFAATFLHAPRVVVVDEPVAARRATRPGARGSRRRRIRPRSPMHSGSCSPIPSPAGAMERPPRSPPGQSPAGRTWPGGSSPSTRASLTRRSRAYAGAPRAPDRWSGQPSGAHRRASAAG